MDNQEFEGLTDPKEILQAALEQGNKRAEEAMEAFESQGRDEEFEMPEIPDDLDEGAHTLDEMGVLARLGKETHAFDFYGNKIVLRTLTVGEELEILQKCARFVGQAAQSRAYVIYCTANAIESVNGKPYFKRLPLGPKDDMQTYKFEEFQKLFPVTINTFADEYQNMRRIVEDKARYAKKG